MKPVIYLDDERLLRSYDRIGEAIVDYIAERNLSWEIEMAKKIYFGTYSEAISQRSTDFSYKPFIQWLLFSYKLENGHSLIDCIYNTYTKNTHKFEIDALINLRNTYESLYKVYSVVDDRILVKDIFTQEIIYIYDNLLLNNIKRYCGIFTRIAKVNNKSIPIPGYSVMTNSFLKEVEKYLLNKYKEFSKFKEDISIRDFINSNSLMVHRYFLYHDI